MIKTYLVVINIISFFTYGLDKYLAIKNKRRISENSLISLSIIGGSIGSILGMFFFHHKTKKKRFLIMNPLILIVQILLYLNI